MLEKICAGTVDILPDGELEKKLAQKRPLRVKLGADPTASDLHLGHAVVLSKLRQFQDAGHTIQFIIGDFTALIGDPTGKSKTRPPLTEQEIQTHAQTYLEQVGRVLDTDKLEIVYNSHWLNKLSVSDFVKLAGQVTLARIIEREDFMSRYKSGVSIGFHELLYPLMQGYDSVHLESDIELGGTDQTFNLLMGRYLQEQYGKEPQVIITLPLLEGLDGVKKMSKSLGNYIGLAEPADKAYGKLMSISDELMWRYWLLLGNKSESEIEELKSGVASGTIHPLELKKEMAFVIISRFWGKSGAEHGREQFESLFQKKDYSQAEEARLDKIFGSEKSLWIVNILKNLGAIQSSSEARRLIQAGAVSINGEKVTDFKAEIAGETGMIIKVGKHRIYKLV